MTIDACIAHAIHNDLDIVEACPQVRDCPIEKLEALVESYVVRVQREVKAAVQQFGQACLEGRDPVGLFVALLPSNLPVPPEMLRKMCHTIVELYPVDARFLGVTRDGRAAFLVRMTVLTGYDLWV